PTAPHGHYTLSLHDALPILNDADKPCLLHKTLDGGKDRILACTGPSNAEKSKIGLGLIGAILDVPQPNDISQSEQRARCRQFQADRKSTRLNSSHVKISYAV